MTLREICQPRWLLSSLLIVGALLFASGIVAERDAVAHHTEAPGGEAAEHPESSAETVLGLDLESNVLVIVVVAVSLAFAALTWFRNRRTLLLATMGFAIAFTAFDIAEVAHQTRESRTGLAVLATIIAVVHLTTALVAHQRAP